MKGRVDFQTSISKIKRALMLAKTAHVGCTLTLFDVIELLGYIGALEETIADPETIVIDVGNVDCNHENDHVYGSYKKIWQCMDCGRTVAHG